MRKTVLLAGVLLAGMAVAESFSAFAPGEVTVGGEIGRRMSVTAGKLLHKTDIEQVFFRHFRDRKDKPDVWGGFTGWGMTLDAIVKAAAYGVGGAEMKAFKAKWVAETISTQTPDGAISFFTPGHLGMWDNHEQAYLVQAFCNDWRWAGNRAALEAAKRLGDYLIARKSGVNLGLETAFVMLYRETGDERYADYLRTAFLIEKDNVAFDAIAVNGVAHVYTWIQRALAQLQYAEATGRNLPVLTAATDELYRRAFGDFLSVSGSMSGGPLWGEIWDDSQIGLGKWGETCVSAYLLRCTAERMRLHPETRYGDLYERVLYNAFFGAQSADGAKQRYFIPFDEPGEWFAYETYCCPNNLRRMMFELPGAVFFRTADGFAVNLYAPATLKSGGLEVQVETDYPREGRVAVAVKSDKPGKVRLRVPRWTGIPDAGTWREKAYGVGETRFELDFPMTVRLVKGRKAKAGRVAVMRGPVVYALDTTAAKGWKGFVDCLQLAADRPLVWTGTGVRAEFFEDRGKRPWHTFELRPFASDTRLRTYFPTTAPATAAVDDELYGAAQVPAVLTTPGGKPYAISAREIYVDHEKNHRSGHMGHALVDAGKGRLLDFNSNVDGDRCTGHSGYGWMEYRVSSDYGRSWGETRILPYSMRLFREGKHTALCEKGVRAPDGRIILFFQITDTGPEICCEPWSAPTMCFSTDGGETFSDAVPTGAKPGRIYDAVVDDRFVYFLLQENEHFLGSRPEHVYKVYRSEAGGPFVGVTLPLSARGKGYGAMEFAKDGSLVAYVYDSAKEDQLEYVVSRDRGLTWSQPARSRVAKLIRNPQVRRLGDAWFLVGRNGGGGDGLVLYSSDDGLNWDEGRMVDRRPPKGGTGYYSCLLPVLEPGRPPRMLLQYSHVYSQNRVNIAHRWITLGESNSLLPY